MMVAAMTDDPDDTGKRADGRGDLLIPGLSDGFAAIDLDSGRVRFAGAMGAKGPAVFLLHGHPPT